MKIKTRFAPSPSGNLHIGGARTALFNYLFSKYNDGDFFIRIENTNLKKSSDESVLAIKESLNWLNIVPTSKIKFQSDNFSKHLNVAFNLLKEGYAYKCYLSDDELDVLRKKSRINGRPIKSPYRDEINNNSSKEFVIRLKMPDKGHTIIKDIVQGEIKVRNDILDDMVLLKKDQKPTYMLASVVDDNEMNISHIIRGDDHLNNAFRQIQIIKYLKWPIPIYAHIPLIHGEDGTKLSKRHGNNNVLDFKNLGIDAISLNNYLLRLGYSINNDKIYDFENEKFNFKLEKLNKSPSKFDEKKLISINSSYLQNEKIDLLLEKVNKLTGKLDNVTLRTVEDILPDLLKRYKFLKEIKEDIKWIDDKKFKINDNSIILELKKNKQTINKICEILKSCDWELNTIKTNINKYINENDKKISEIAPILRLGLTGKANTPDILK